VGRERFDDRMERSMTSLQELRERLISAGMLAPESPFPPPSVTLGGRVLRIDPKGIRVAKARMLDWERRGRPVDDPAQMPAEGYRTRREHRDGVR
jgi:hypothetical protein